MKLHVGLDSCRIAAEASKNHTNNNSRNNNNNTNNNNNNNNNNENNNHDNNNSNRKSKSKLNLHACRSADLRQLRPEALWKKNQLQSFEAELTKGSATL